jgi:hypothetical protein
MRERKFRASWVAAAGASLLVACGDDGSTNGPQADVGAADSSQQDVAPGDAADDATAADDARASADGGDDDTPTPDPGPLACSLPQSPRDLSVEGGVLAMTIPGPGSEAQWLCNVHFHDPLEHAGVGLCPEVTAGGADVCVPSEDGGEAEPVSAGDLIEVHWVYSSCQPAEAAGPTPGLGLAPCVCDGGQVLRVRAQVFVVDGADTAEGSMLAPPEGMPLASYAGSTTGSKYDGLCSEVAVNWEVGTECHRLARPSLGAWCEENAFGEAHGHAPRELITEPSLLSPYSPSTAD